MRLVTLCGSLGPGSSNQAALAVASEHAAGRGATLVEAPDPGTVPAFRPADVDTPPESVAALRDVLESADAVLLAAPEYAAGVCGSTKNLLDWMVGSGSLYHRPFALMSVGTTGGPFAIEQLVRTLSWQGALVLATLGIDLPRTRIDADGRFPDAATRVQIAHWADSLLDALDGDAAGRRRALDAEVSRYGIDVSRFGDIA